MTSDQCWRQQLKCCICIRRNGPTQLARAEDDRDTRFAPISPAARKSHALEASRKAFALVQCQHAARRTQIKRRATVALVVVKSEISVSIDPKRSILLSGGAAHGAARYGLTAACRISLVAGLQNRDVQRSPQDSSNAEEITRSYIRFVPFQALPPTRTWPRWGRGVRLGDGPGTNPKSQIPIFRVLLGSVFDPSAPWA